MIEDIINIFLSNNNVTKNSVSGIFTGITVGVVIDTDDPMQAGRLRVFCPSLNDDPKQLEDIPWCVYASPFAGSINNNTFMRGSDPDNCTTEGSVHYGFWAIPEVGATVLVTCIDGDYRRRVWLACLPSFGETNTLHGGRWKWDNGKVDGPFSSSGEKIEPQYTNLSEAFSGAKDSPEWKSRIADYQTSALRDDYVTDIKENDQTVENIIKNEKDQTMHDSLGSHGYDWTPFGVLGPKMASRVCGVTTPGFHSFVMDDRPFNSRIKFRTASGHQILLDDTNERIYVSTNKGNNWVEMDSNGNIDVYSEGYVSISAAKDINLYATDYIRMYAGRAISAYAGHEKLAAADGTEVKLNNRLLDGTIVFQAETDFSISASNIKTYSYENTVMETGLNFFKKIGDTMAVYATNDLSFRTEKGDHIITSGRSIYSTSEEMTKNFSKGTVSVSALQTTELHSFGGKTEIGGAESVVVKSPNSISVSAGDSSGGGQPPSGMSFGGPFGASEASGVISFTVNGSHHRIASDGVTTVSNGKIISASKQEVSHAVAPSLNVSPETLPDPSKLIGSLENINLNKITSSNIYTKAILGDLIQKTKERGHSYNILGDQIDTLSKNVNILTAEVGSFMSAVQKAISLLKGRIDLNFTIDIGCAIEQIYKLLPQSLLNLFATFNDFKAKMRELGYEIKNLQDMLNHLTNPSILQLLGLPDLSISMSAFNSSCTTKMPLFNGNINLSAPQTEVPQEFREIIKNIYDSKDLFIKIPPLKPIDWNGSYGS